MGNVTQTATNYASTRKDTVLLYIGKKGKNLRGRQTSIESSGKAHEIR